MWISAKSMSELNAVFRENPNEDFYGYIPRGFSLNDYASRDLLVRTAGKMLMTYGDITKKMWLSR